MAIRPAFQFYPDNWLSDKELRRCNHELKGIWIDLMCVLHDSDEYGILRWTMEELAQAVGTTTYNIKKLFDYGILKGGPMDTIVKGYTHVTKNGVKEILIPPQKGPLFYCKRMVKDEHFRQKRGSHGTKSIYNENVPKKKSSKDTIESKKQDSKDTIDRSPSSLSLSLSLSTSQEGSAKPKEEKGQEFKIQLFPDAGVSNYIVSRFPRGLRKAPDLKSGSEVQKLFEALENQYMGSQPREMLLAFILTACEKENPVIWLKTVLSGCDYPPGEDMMSVASKQIKKWDQKMVETEQS